MSGSPFHYIVTEIPLKHINSLRGIFFFFLLNIFWGHLLYSLLTIFRKKVVSALSRNKI